MRVYTNVRLYVLYLLTRAIPIIVSCIDRCVAVWRHQFFNCGGVITKEDGKTEEE